MHKAEWYTIKAADLIEKRDRKIQSNAMDKVKNNELYKFSVRVQEVAGFVAALEALHLPFGKDVKSDVEFRCFTDNMPNKKLVCCQASAIIHEHDIKLMQKLAKAGDEHAKVLRGIKVWMEIDAPRYWWQEMDTYKVGTDRLSSESTMHMQCKCMSEEELVLVKSELKEGTMQKRSQVFSYQTLRRIYAQRHNHRLPQWRAFCKEIEYLPYASELILVGLTRRKEKAE